DLPDSGLLDLRCRRVSAPFGNRGMEAARPHHAVAPRLATRGEQGATGHGRTRGRRRDRGRVRSRAHRSVPGLRASPGVCRLFQERVLMRMRFAEAINAALREEMQRDETVFLFGDDIGTYGGVFKATRDLMREFGPERVRDTPISEQTLA